MGINIYEISKSIGERKFLEYLSYDWNETKADFRNITDASCRGVKWTTKNSGHILAKASYPLTGNLTMLVRDRIEDCLGKGIYNSDSAGNSSLLTNFLLYGVAGVMLSHSSEGLGVGLIAIPELLLRVILSDKESRKLREVPASLLGKLASIPIEAGIGVYDGIKARKLRGETR